MIAPLSQDRGAMSPSAKAEIPALGHFRANWPVSFVEEKIKPELLTLRAQDRQSVP
jgi:hypothetical protein